MASTQSAPPIAADRATPIRVASVPAAHVYVRHLATPEGDDGVVRLADVPPDDGRTAPGSWWPPVMLDGDWIRGHAATFDVFHVHFGFDAKTVEELRDVVAALREVGVPLVLTVHDLRNPHHEDRRTHDAQLDVLVDGAAALLTLTPGAAEELRRRWGREALVLPHPHVVEPERMVVPRPAHEGFVVGIHAKSLRANTAAPAVAEALVEIVDGLPDATLRVDLHEELSDPGSHAYAPEAAAALRALGDRGPHVEVREHGYFSDAELWDYLANLDASVLPYRFGTHSGWLEACRDLGTAVIAPDCGRYAEQGPCWVYGHDERRLDVASLTAAVRGAHAAHRAAGARDAGTRAAAGVRDTGDRAAFVAERLAQRRAVAAAHRRVYAGLLA